MRVRVVLMEPEGEENIGYVARAMANFGLNDLALVRPKARIGALARQRAMHGRNVLANARTFTSLGRACRGSNLVVGTTGKRASGYSVLRTPMTPREFATAAAEAKGRVSVVFGRESIGLTNAELERCGAVLIVPSEDAYPVLNVSHAVAIVLYELFGAAAKPGREQPSRAEMEVLRSAFSRLVATLGYTKTKEKIVERAFFNVLSRSLISRREFFTLAGLFRRMRRKSLK